ncbi:MAG TPA: hypothetical protein VIV13_02220, partial [Solirubrobacterales bacterium]
EFVKDEARRGTASAVWNVLRDRRLSEFIYSHGNVLVGEDSLRRIAQASSEASALAVSADSQGETHPRVRVGADSLVEGIADVQASVRSVGLAVFRAVPEVSKGNDPAAHVPVESMMLETSPLSTVKAVDVGSDWRHLEDLSFYP